MKNISTVEFTELLEYRATNGLSQQAMADKLVISHTSYLAIEKRHTKKPNDAIIKRIADMLEIPFLELRTTIIARREAEANV